MPAPWVAGAELRIVGTLHGQQTVNVLNFATNDQIQDEGDLDTLLLQLAQAMLDCVIQVLLPAVTSDWTCVQVDARRIYPVRSDPVIATAPAGSVGAQSASSSSFIAALVNIRTGGGGKRGRGRIFLPPPGELEIAGSAINNNVLLLIAAYLTCVAGKFLGANPTTAWRLGVLSRTNLAGIIGNFDNSFRIATQLSPVANVSCLRSRKVGHGS